MSGKNTIILIIAILANILVGFGLYYYAAYHPKLLWTAKQTDDGSVSTQNKTAASSKTGSAGSGKATANQAANGTANVNTYVDNGLSCHDEGCFNVRFPSCKPAEFTKNTNDESVSGYAAMYYRIVGYVKGGCQVYVKYTSHPNGNMINKPMTCVLNNRKSFFTAFNEQYLKIFQGASTCKGELVSLLSS